MNSPQNFIVKMQFGSQIYGTSVPTSDLDIKGIYIPSMDEILLQRVKKSINTNTKKNPEQKNGPEDVDMELFSLQSYLNLLMEGQIIAIDMLFTPKSFYLQEAIEPWHEIQKNKKYFLHKGVSAFAGYCKQQAAKYGIKGSRIGSLRKFLAFLEELPQDDRIGTFDNRIMEYFKGMDHFDLVICKGPNNQMLPHFEICNRKIGMHVTVGYAAGVFQKILDNYGQRALLAEKNEGIDWKALMHAVRVVQEAIELFSTHQISFPRPERDILLKIRKGEMKYKEVADLIENGLERMEKAAKESSLPEKPNHELADEITLKWYGKKIIHESNSLFL